MQQPPQFFTEKSSHNGEETDQVGTMGQRTGVEDATMQVQLGEVGGVGFVGEVINNSGYQKKLQTDMIIEWHTLLKLEPDKQYITSEDYVTGYGTENESVWRVELDPNYVDPSGERLLSVYLNLVETHAKDGVINVLYTVYLHTSICTYFSEDKNHLYKKCAGVTQFSKDSPVHGFNNFIPYHCLGPCTRLDKPEKLQFIVVLQIITDDPVSEESQERTPIPKTCVPDVPLFYNHGAPLNLDSRLYFEKQLIAVDSERLSYYTSFFEDYYIREVNGEFPSRVDGRLNLQGQFETKILLLKIIEFCHDGKLAVMPKRWSGLIRLLQRVTELGIVQLKAELQLEIMTRMNPERFTEVVELTREGIFDYQVSYPFLYEYLIKNRDKLAKEQTYKDTFQVYKKTYAEMLVYSENDER